MKPKFLLSEQVVRENGTGPAIDLGESNLHLVKITLGITRNLEQESIDVAIYGSADGETFSEKPIAAFPQKFYCGVYPLELDLSESPDVRYLRVAWKVNRWGRGTPTPLFHIYVFAEPVTALAAAV
jgi:hypothetical protein